MDRAQFLQGLRTGGPRSASFGNTPMSANPTTTRFASNTFQPQFEDSSAQLVDRFGNMNVGENQAMNSGLEDAMVARLQQAQQQQQQLIMMQAQAQVATMLAQGGGPLAEAQAMHMQMEVMRLQALQQQQNFQTQLLMQSRMVAQQQQANQNRRASEAQQVPSSAGPLSSSFADANAAQTRTNAANQLRARAAGREATMRASVSEEQIPANQPMSAAVGGKFAPRSVSSALNPNAAAFVGKFTPGLTLAISAASKAPAPEVGTPQTPTYGATTVISGGTSLGGSANGSASPSLATTPSNSYNGLSGYNNTAATGPTKSDSSSSWRRGSATPGSTPVQTTPTSGFPKPPSPPLRQRSISPPAASKLNLSALGSNGTGETVISPLRVRPSPLRFTTPSGEAFAIARSGSPAGSTDGNDAGSLNDGASNKTSPTSSTPPSSAGSAGLGKEREEASRKLYEGLGLGRPAPSPVVTSFNGNAAPYTLNTSLPTFTTTAPTPININHAAGPIATAPSAKVEPVRQPMGPPGSVEELGPLNFASRLRKKALGGLMDARERRENFAMAQQEMTVY